LAKNKDEQETEKIASSDENIETLFRALSNEARRRIIELLTNGPMYLRQIHRTLEREREMHIQAVTKHLSILEESGILSTYSKRSPRGPDRKYFCLNEGKLVTVFLSPLGLSVPSLLSFNEKRVKKVLARIRFLSHEEEEDEHFSGIKTLKEQFEKSLSILEDFLKIYQRVLKELKSLEESEEL